MKKLYLLLKTGMVSLTFLFCMLLLSNYVTAQTPADITGNPAHWVTWLTSSSPDIMGKDFENDAPDATGKEDVFQSAKDVWDLNLWSWTIAPTSDKTDLTNAGAIIVKDNILYFMGDRIQTDGDAMIGFWVLLGGSTPMPDGTFSPNHQVGDVLILINFRNGGIIAEPEIYSWTAAGLSPDPITLPAGKAGQAANAVEVAVPITTGVPGWTFAPWTYTGKGAPAGTYAPNAFFEGYVDLTALQALTNIPIDLCKATFIMTTRNSPSVSAALADFVWGSFNMTPEAPAATGGSRCGTGTVALTVNPVLAGLTYKWYNVATGGTSLATGSTYSPNVTATTDFWVSASNANCEGPRTKVTATVVNITLSLTQTPVKCVGSTDGTVTATFGGGTSYQAKIDGGVYAPATSPKTFTGLAAGPHTVWVLDASNCSNSSTITVGAATAITLNLTPTPVTCNGSSDGTIAATFSGGTSPYQAKIDGGVYATATSPKTFTGLTQGSHTVWVMDANGCIASKTETVNEAAAITLSLTQIQVSCNGGSDGSVTATFGGGLSPLQAKIDGGTYTITTSPKTYTGLTSGSHTVWVMDANGCVKSSTITVVNPPVVTVSLTQVQVSCNGGSDGSVTATFGGGTGQLQAKLDGGTYTNTTSPKTYTGLTSGSHSVWVMDSKGCVASSTITVVNPPAVTLSLTMTAAPCNGTGTITATFGGGTGAFQAKLDGGTYTTTTSPKTYTGVASGSHTVWVMDSKGCTLSKTITVDQIPCPKEFCTYTQGFYGNQKGKACDLTATVKPGADFTAALLAEGPMVIGAGTNKITFEAGDAPLIKAILPGGGGSAPLDGACNPAAWDPDPNAIINWGCLDPYLKDRQHRLTNTLLAQTITLGLNLRIGDNELGGVQLQSGKWFVTQEKKSCAKGTGFVDPVCCNSGSTTTPVCQLLVDPYKYYKLDAGVMCYMFQKGYAMTVQGLFNLANDALGKVRTFPAKVTCGTPGVEYTVNLSDIAGQVDLINNIFDECVAFVGYWDSPYTCTSCTTLCPRSAVIPGEQETTLGVYPNPFNQKVTFEFVPGKDAHATLEIHNLVGQKVATLLSRSVNEGVTTTVDYTPVNQTPGIYIYRLTIDDEIMTGKIIYNR